MNETTGDLFNYIGFADAICITTNGFTKTNGRAVMGRGCAKEALKRWPDIDKSLGASIQFKGNTVSYLGHDFKDTRHTFIYSFPVKPISAIFNGSNAVRHMINKFNLGAVVPGWACIADINLIEESAKQLKATVDDCGFNLVMLPRPGCGAGELNWEDVKPVLDKHLDNRFYSITFEQGITL